MTQAWPAHCHNLVDRWVRRFINDQHMASNPEHAAGDMLPRSVTPTLAPHFLRHVPDITNSVHGEQALYASSLKKYRAHVPLILKQALS